MNITKEQVLEALKNVEDPDLKKHLVTLGMIKDLEVAGKNISFTVVLRTPACPMKDLIYKNCVNAILQYIGEEAIVNVKMTSDVSSRKSSGLMLPNVKNIIGVASAKGGVGKSTLVSPRSLEDDKLKLVATKDWTSGFFPGELWYLYELTKNDKCKQEAKKFTAPMEKEKLNGGTHDMGFKIYCSFGNAYRLTKNEHDKEVIIQAAKTLSTRFNLKIGAIKSWDHNNDKWKFPIIIDNMLNLELLFEATKLSGDSSFYKIAVAHANTTMRNHFRKDYSTWHVVSYDPETGEVEKKGHIKVITMYLRGRGDKPGLYMVIPCAIEKQRILNI